MYTNIDTMAGIQSFRDFFASHEELIPENFPVNLFLRILELVMNNNIFSFGSTTWLQLSGAVMGTPAACSYATITYGQYENTRILTEFNANLLYYRQYIDDIFGIWVLPKTEKETTWKEFKKRINQLGCIRMDHPRALQELEPQHRIKRFKNPHQHLSKGAKSLLIYISCPNPPTLQVA
jgi:hypothetical protein